MPQNITLQDLLDNPDFHNLSHEEQVKAFHMISGGPPKGPGGINPGRLPNMDFDTGGDPLKPGGLRTKLGLAASRATGLGISEDQGFLQSLNPISNEQGAVGGLETLMNLGMIAGPGLARGAAKTIMSRGKNLLAPFTKALATPIVSTATKDLTSNTARTIGKEATERLATNVQKGRGITGKFAGKRARIRTTDLVSKQILQEQLARNLSESTSVPLEQLLMQTTTGKFGKFGVEAGGNIAGSLARSIARPVGVDAGRAALIQALQQRQQNPEDEY